MPSLRSLVSGGLLILAGSFVFQACSSQGEGMRCEENADCESGLTCEARSCCSEKICCPAQGAHTTSECGGAAVAPTDTGVSETAADTGAADTGAADTGAAETATDTGTDTGAPDADAGSD